MQLSNLSYASRFAKSALTMIVPFFVSLCSGLNCYHLFLKIVLYVSQLWFVFTILIYLAPISLFHGAPLAASIVFKVLRFSLVKHYLLD